MIIKRKQAVEDDDGGAIAPARESLLRWAQERGIALHEVLAKELLDNWYTFFDIW
jgi:hypothetical protein